MSAVLHVVSDRGRNQLPLEQALLEAAKGGADILQIRDKKAPARETYELCQTVQKSVRELGLKAQIFVNDRADIALAAGLQGIHLANRSLPVTAVRSLAQHSQWQPVIGVSVHSLDEALAAQDAGANYVTFGHIYASESKRGLPPRGIFALERIVSKLDIPVVAIGGIDKSNAAPVLETGVSGIAVIGAVLGSQTPRELTESLKSEMEKTRVQPKIPFPNPER